MFVHEFVSILAPSVPTHFHQVCDIDTIINIKMHLKSAQFLFYLLLFCTLFFPIESVIALTPFPSFTTYYEMYPGASASAGPSIVFNVTADHLYAVNYEMYF